MNLGKRVGPFGFLVFVCLSFCRLTQADLLVLKNGDRITGDIKRIWDSEISIEPAYAVEFDVDVSVVEYIESDRVFEIGLEDGQSMVASFAGADGDGNQISESLGKLRNFVVVCGLAMSGRGEGTYQRPVLEIQSNQGESARQN